MRSNHTVRLNAANRYASGVLVTRELVDAALSIHAGHGAGAFRPQVADRAEFILTAAHFLRGPAGRGVISVRNSAFSATARGHISIFGTDIAVLKLTHRAPTTQLPAISPWRLSLGQRTLTQGFGGRATALVPKDLQGRVLLKVPFALSRNPFTRVRHGAMVLNHPTPAVRGDSGGPVLSGGLVYGLQSMITDPLGFNTRVGTIAVLAPHLPAIRRAMEQLSGGST